MGSHLPKASSIPSQSLNQPVMAAEGTLPALTLLSVCFPYNSLKRLRRQRFLRHWQHCFGTYQAQLGLSFGCISHCTQSFGSCSISIALPAHDRDTAAFPKHSWYAWGYKSLSLASCYNDRSGGSRIWVAGEWSFLLAPDRAAISSIPQRGLRRTASTPSLLLHNYIVVCGKAQVWVSLDICVVVAKKPPIS